MLYRKNMKASNKIIKPNLFLIKYAAFDNLL